MQHLYGLLYNFSQHETETLNLTRHSLAPPHLQKLLLLPLQISRFVGGFGEKMQPRESIEFDDVCCHFPAVNLAANHLEFIALDKAKKTGHALSMQLVAAEKNSKCVLKFCHKAFKWFRWVKQATMIKCLS